MEKLTFNESMFNGIDLYTPLENVKFLNKGVFTFSSGETQVKPGTGLVWTINLDDYFIDLETLAYLGQDTVKINVSYAIQTPSGKCKAKLFVHQSESQTDDTRILYKEVTGTTTYTSYQASCKTTHDALKKENYIMKIVYTSESTDSWLDWNKDNYYVKDGKFEILFE